MLILCSRLLLAQPGKDGALTVSSSSFVANRYAPVSTSITAGSNTLIIAPGPSFSLCTGDLIMVYQAQGAVVNSTNSATYGDITAYNSAGLFEFKYVQSVNGATVTTQTTFTNSYSLNGRVQVVKVPQYSSLTLNASARVVARPWKDTTISSQPYRFGGLVVIHAANIVNNGTITASNSGFRGGIVNVNGSYTTGITAYVSNLLIQGGIKGEGIAGAPVDYDLIGGRYCRGAPANGGGGGTSTNASGGGGANGNNGNAWSGQGVMITNTANPISAWGLDPAYINNGNALTNSSGGGRGGYSWGNANANASSDPPGASAWAGDNRREVGGLGGRPLTNIHPETRIYFGGGGGAGDANNNGGTSGGNGGGIIYLIVSSAISGTGTIESNGASVPLSVGCHCDGHGGAGAGGSIVIKCNNIASNLIISAKGGEGGSQFIVTPPGLNTESEGPGGGGGGGFIALSGSGAVGSVNGGMNGITSSLGVTEFPYNGGTSGATGHTTTVSGNFISFIPPLISSSSPVCPGGSFTLSTSTVGVASYNWLGPNGFFSSSTVAVINNVGMANAGIYTLQLVHTNSCTTSNTINITVEAAPVVTVVSSPTVICPAESATLQAVGALSYTWLPSATNSSTLVVNPASTTIYTVIGTNSVGCSVTALYIQTVAPQPTVTISTLNSIVCAGDTVVLIANGAQNYVWLPGNNTTSVNVIPVPGPVTFSVFGTSPQNCTNHAVYHVTTSPLPTVIASVSQNSVCPSEVFTLTASGAINYTWMPSSQMTAQHTQSVNQTTTYTVSGTSASGCLSDTSITVFVKPAPSMSFNTASITCASLGFGTVVATANSGPFSYTWNPTGQQSSIASGLYPGTYTITVSDSLTGCVFTPTTNFPPLIPFTGTIIATPSVPCFAAQTASATISLSGGSGRHSYLWTSPTGTQSVSVATMLPGGTHTILVTDSVTFCQVSQTFQIIRPPAVTLTVVSDSRTVCLGGQITLSAVANGGTAGYTYTWSTGQTTSTLQLVNNVAGNYTYSIASSDANNCIAHQAYTVDFIPNPTVTVVPDSICPYQTGVLLAQGAATYTWNTGSSSNPLLQQPAGTTQYTVAGSLSGCTSTATGHIFLKSLPVATISSNSPLCPGDSLLLQTSGSYSYSWQGPSAFSSQDQNPVLYNVTTQNNGVYSLTVTSSNSCSLALTSSVLINAQPPLVVIGATVCEGQPLQLFSNYLSGGNYSWSGPHSFVSNQQTVLFSAAHASLTGTYSIILTNAATNCSSAASVKVLVEEPPQMTINTDSILCAGETFSAAVSGGSSYHWNGPNGFYSSQASISVFNVKANAVFSLNVKSGNCSVDTVIRLQVVSLPSVILSLNTDSACISSTALFQVSSQPPAKTYTITGPHGIISDDQLQSLSLQHAGSYSVTLLDTNGCAGNAVTSLFVYPQADILVNGDTVCAGGTGRLVAWGGKTYSWMGPQNFTSNTASATILNAGPQVAGIYTVFVHDINGCVSAATTEVIYVPFSFTPPRVIPGKKYACLHSDHVLSAEGGISYLWTGPNNYNAIGPKVILAVKNLSISGIYTVTAKNENNCSASSTINILAVNAAEVKLNTTENWRCAPFCTEVFSTTPNHHAILTQTLYINNQPQKTGLGRYCFSEPGTYDLQLYYTDTNLCVNSSTVLVNTLPRPEVDFYFNPEKPIANIENVYFYNRSTPRDLSFCWFLPGFDSIKEKEPKINFPMQGTIPVTLVGINEFGCRDTITKVITVGEELLIYIPDAFTPNGDGLNDLFAPKGYGIEVIGIEIYDRWGEQVFANRHGEEGWNGIYMGGICKPDIYSYKIILKDFKGKQHQFQGHVTLVK